MTDEAHIESVQIGQLETDKELVAKAARQPGGVRVLDEHGVYKFRLSIPSTPLPEDPEIAETRRILAKALYEPSDLPLEELAQLAASRLRFDQNGTCSIVAANLQTRAEEPAADALEANLDDLKKGSDALIGLGAELVDSMKKLVDEAQALDAGYEDAVRALAREVIASADDDDDNDHPDNIVDRDAHALRVLIEGRLADDIATAVAELRAGAKP